MSVWQEQDDFNNKSITNYTYILQQTQKESIKYCLKYDKNLIPILEKKKHYEILDLIFCLTF